MAIVHYSAAQWKDTKEHPMLQVPNRYSEHGTYGGHQDDEPITKPIIAALRRHLRVLLACIGLGIAAGALYVVAAQPSYTAVATLILDAGSNGLQEGQTSTNSALDGSAVDSQVEIITSGRITSLVVDKLDLANDLDLARSSLFARVLAPARQLISSLMPQRESNAVMLESAQRQAVLRRVNSNLSARRIGRSYLIEIGFRHPDPVRAALIANSFASSYLDDLLAAKYAAAQRGTEWLEKRVDELRQKSFQSELAVQEFRAEQVLRSGSRQSSGDPIVERIVTLRELERAAETSRLVFQNYLQRYQAALQQQSAPMTEARLLTEALPPVSSSNPELLVVTLTAILGFVVGGVAVLIREGSEKGLRTGRQLHEFLRIEFLGNIPKTKIGRLLRHLRRNRGGSAQRYKLVSFEEDLEYPTSVVGETLRSIKVAADNSSGDSAAIIGITSTLGREGVTTLAKDFASFLSRLGHKTILIDGNLRDRGLTRALVPHARSGLAEILNGEALKDHSLYEESSRLTILPAPETNLSHMRDRLGSEDMRDMLRRLRGQFRYVVIDLPPIGLSSDSKAVAPYIDCAVLAVEWGSTPADAVQEALRHNGPLADKWIGAVLTKVDMARLARY